MKHCLIASCIYINTTRNMGEMRIVSNHSARVIGYPVFVHHCTPMYVICVFVLFQFLSLVYQDTNGNYHNQYDAIDQEITVMN